MRTIFIKEKKCKRCGKIELARFIKDELCDDCYYNVDRFSENQEKIKRKDKWQKLKEWVEEREKKHKLMLKASAFEDTEILKKMQELEAEE